MITKNNNARVDAFSELASATDEFELYRNEHAARIADIADEIAQRFLLASRDRKSLRAAALLHDLGEAAMERDYIQRAGQLTEVERTDLARHPIIGEQEAARAGADRATTLLVRWHHEWWNGGGYPDGLRGEEIPLAGRILRLADSYASLTAARPFRKAYSAGVAREMIVQRAGIEFDPRVVKAFVELDLTENFEPEVDLKLDQTESVEPAVDVKQHPTDNVEPAVDVKPDQTENVEPAVDAVAEKPAYESKELFSSFMK